MTTRNHQIKEIVRALTWFLSTIETHNKELGQTDINKEAEDFLIPILNALYNTKLSNLNHQKLHYPGVDIGDTRKKVAHQITSETNRSGIQEKVNAIGQNKVNKTFTDISFIILRKRKPKFKASFKTKGYTLTTSKIFGFDDVIAQIARANAKQIKTIFEHVKLEIPTPATKQNKSAIDQSVVNPSSTDVYLADLEFSTEQRKQYNPKIALEYLITLEKRKWDSSPDVVKYKILAAKGLCFLQLNQTNEACKLLIQAFAYNKTGEKAMGLRALAHAILGEKEEARKYISKAIKLNPCNEDAYSALIVVNKDNSDFSGVVAQIPACLATNPQVAYALAHQARDLKLKSEALKWYEVAMQNSKENNADIKGAYGSAILEFGNNPFDFVTKQLDADRIDDIKKGIRLISEAWEQVKNSDLKFTRAHLLINKSIANKMLSKWEDALFCLQEAAQLVPNDEVVQRHLAIALSETGKYPEALEVLAKSKVINQADITVDILKATILFEASRCEEAIELANALLSNPLNDKEKEEVYAVLVNSTLKLEKREEALVRCETAINSVPNPVRFILFRSRILDALNRPAQAKEDIEKAKASINAQSTQEDHYDLGKTFFQKKQYKEASEFLEKVVNPKVYSPLSKLLVQSYLHSENFRKALDHCTILRQQYGNKDFIIDIEAFIYTEILDYPKAIALCTNFLVKEPSNQRVIFRLCHIYYITREKTKLSKLVHLLNTVDDQNFELRFQIAWYYLAIEKYQEALEISYGARRDNFSIGEAHKLFFGVQTGVPNEFVQKNLINLPSVASHNIVTLFHKESRTELIRRIVPYENVRSDFGEIHIDDEFAKALVGKALNAEVIFKNQTFIIKSIESVYTAAFTETANLLSTIYADVSGFKILFLPEIKSGNPKIDFKPLFDELDKFEESEKILHQFYKTNRMPIGSLAKFTNTSPIRIWSNLVSNPELGIYSISTPSYKQQLPTANRVENNLIVDALAVMTLFAINKQQILLLVPGESFVAQATINVFKDYLEDLQDPMKSAGFNTVGKFRGQYFREEITPESVQNGIKYYTNLIAWLESNLKVLPSLPDLEVDSSEKKYLEDILGRSFLDSILIAKKEKLLLLSDDQRLREVALNEHRVAGLGTHDISAFLHSLEIITRKEFDTIAGALINIHYKEIPVNANVLWDAAEKTVFQTKHPLTSALDSITHVVSNENSSIAVAAEFLREFYLQMELPQEREKIVGYVLNLLCKGRQTKLVLKKLRTEVNIKFDLLRPQQEHILQLIDAWQPYL
jgi:tetratricopeptide (TPR) repeat protein